MPDVPKHGGGFFQARVFLLITLRRGFGIREAVATCEARVGAWRTTATIVAHEIIWFHRL